MRVESTFSKAFQALKSDKRIAVPSFLFVVSTLVILALLIQLTGFGSYLSAINELSERYALDGSAQEQPEQVLEDLLDIGSLLSIRNATLLLLALLAFFVLFFFFSCASLSMITLHIKSQPLTFKNSVRMLFSKLVRYVVLWVLIYAVLYVPVIASMAIVIIATVPLHSLLVTLLSVLLVILLSVAYVIFMMLRLMFSSPSLFLDGKAIFGSFSNSYRITGLNMLQVVIIGVILLGFTIAESIVRRPTNQALTSLVASGSIFIIVPTAIALVVLVIILTGLLALGDCFLMYSYLDYKDHHAT